MALAERFSRIDRLLPGSVRDAAPTLRWRGRLVVMAAIAAVVWGPVFAIFVAREGTPELAWVILGHAGAMVLAPGMVRLTGSAGLGGNIVMLSMFGLVMLGVAANGGIAAPALVWLTLLPIGGFLLGGERSGWLWAVASVAAVVALFAETKLAGGVPELPPRVEAAYPAIRMINLLAVLSLVTLFTRRALGERERALDEMTRARDDAEAANQAKSRFLASMSHEIRTPLSGVLGSAELLATSDLSPEQSRLVETIRRGGTSLMALIDDLLDLSRIESGHVAVRAEEIDPVEVAQGVREILAQLAHTKGLDLTLHVRPEVPRGVIGDATRLRQILINLVGNAIKFTERGRVDLLVSAEPDRESGRARLRFAVRDTGIGIAPELVDRVFERFTQVDDGDTRRHGGAGLGLAIAQQLAELLGGELGVESRPGHGSCFWLVLPVEVVAGDAPPRSRPEAASPPSAAREPELPARILLAEDNRVNQRIVVEILERLGHRVVLVEDGRAALDAAVRGGFDLVLMDCQMPELDGFEVTRRLRAHERERGGHLPVVALTASSLPGDRERCHAAGMDGYLAKPISISGLEAALAQWLPTGDATPRAESGAEDPAPAVLDASVLAELRGLDADGGLLVELAKSYREVAPTLEREMARAIASGRPRVLAEAAHSLKSSSAAIGASEVAALCRELEAKGRAGTLADAEPLLCALRAGLREVQGALERWEA